jgi:NAD(P)-dependent dehydrogenase (short-subunit alcohol dehydrogenase family)
MGYALSGKTALVTGANRGLGEAIVDALVAAGVKQVYAAARNISTLDPLVGRHGSRPPPPPRRTSTSWSTTPALSASSVATSRIRSGLRAGDRRWK